MREAIVSFNQLSFPSVTLRVEDFLSMGKLRPYEEVRPLLAYIDRIEELSNCPPDIRIVFFSHEWTSRHEPDHTGQQYAVMKEALQTVIAANKWKRESVRVWVGESTCLGPVTSWSLPLPLLEPSPLVRPRPLLNSGQWIGTRLRRLLQHTPRQPALAEARDQELRLVCVLRTCLRRHCTPCHP